MIILKKSYNLVVPNREDKIARYVNLAENENNYTLF